MASKDPPSTAPNPPPASGKAAPATPTKPAQPPPDPFATYRTGVETLRGALKWAISGVAAIGAVLVSSIPLANIGAVSGRDRIWVAIGVGLVVGGVLAIILSGLRIMRSRAVYFGDIPEPLPPCKEERRDSTGRGGRRWAAFRGDFSFSQRARTNRLEWFEDQTSLTPVQDMRRARCQLRELIRQCEQTSESQQAHDNVKEFRKRDAQIGRQLTELAWVARLEYASATFRQGVAITALAVIAIAVGMAFLIDGLHDSTAQRKAAADANKVEAEAALTFANAEKVEVETLILVDRREGTETGGDGDGESDNDSIGVLNLSFGDLVIATGGNAGDCTSGPDEAEFLEGLAAWVLNERGFADIPFVDEGELAEFIADRIRDLPFGDLPDRILGIFSSDGETRICDDWREVVVDIVNDWSQELDLSSEGGDALAEVVIGGIEARFGAVIDAATSSGSIATAIVVVDNTVNAPMPMD